MKPTLWIALTSACLLAGCGGGGGSGGLGNGNPPSAMVRITAANGVAVTKAAYEAALASVTVGELSSNTGIVAGAPSGVNKVSSILSPSSKTTSRTIRVPIPPTEAPCDVSGSVTISGDIADIITPTLSPGDFFDIEFNLCDDGLGDVTNGDLHFDVDAFSGDFLGGLYDMTMTLSLDNFQVTTSEDTLTSNGGATVTLNTANSPSVSASVSGTSITVDTNTSSETLTCFLSTQTRNGGEVPSPFTMTASGTLDTTQISGSVRYSTPVTFSGFDNDYPGVGQFLVTGNSSSARLIVEDNVNVRIELDTDGDGEVNETINTTWAELAD